ncbi:hypothetical protein [Novacetimonas pomaceti]|uniref:hypothetical protein n=1 Tax=Novacetimonas pomaceti TaxID=2021998 RepID=UPI001C2DE3F6|nr:hypothetical protein [Novacetimonas pomaceti]MBV1833072.1 hypothetical protein [Novacetimonas pomaceti]
MADKILIGCRLPHGLTLPPMKEGAEPVTLKGAYSHPSFNAASGHIAPWAYGKTMADADLWAEFKKQYGDKFKPLSSGAIFEVKKPADAEKMAIERQDERTGLERISPDDLARDKLQQIDPKSQKPVKNKV